ncbi:MAG: ATP-binding protein [Gammaproteobacteria bacterium]
MSVKVRLTLFHKLLATFSVATLASVVVFAAITQISMGRHFLRYLNDAHEQRLSMLAVGVADQFEQSGSLSHWQDNPRAWRRQVDEARQSMRRDGPPGRLKLKRFPLATLYDAQFKVIAGDRPYHEGLLLKPVEVDGQTIAWIGAPPLKRPFARRDLDFVKRQGNVLSGGAIAVLVLVFIGAVLTARRLSQPIKRIGDGIRALASGDYETRLAVDSRDEIGELATDFNALARALQENESARQRWIADISHELRTPLAIMRGEVEAARDGVRPNDARLLESLSQETDRLSSLVEDLYLLARADIGSLDYKFESCSLASLVTESLNRFAVRFSDAKLDYSYEVAADVSVHGDKRRLLELLENLLENCARYVTAPGEVKITLTRSNGNAQLYVDDSGPGVPPAQRDVIFDPVSRGEQSRSREYGGAGLGLAICERIAQGHGGQIIAEDSPLGGLRATLTLPLEHPDD